MNTLFKEEQRFTQWWLWLILLVLLLIPLLLWYERLFIDVGANIIGLIVFSAFTFGFVLLFYSIRLKTEIDEKEIRMNFFPLIQKRTRWKEVKSAEIINYGFVGGWGIRLWTRHGTIYNIKGNKGLAVELLNGNKFVIGTQKEKELRKFIAKSFS